MKKENQKQIKIDLFLTRAPRNAKHGSNVGSSKNRLGRCNALTY